MDQRFATPHPSVVVASSKTSNAAGAHHAVEGSSTFTSVSRKRAMPGGGKGATMLTPPQSPSPTPDDLLTGRAKFDSTRTAEQHPSRAQRTLFWEVHKDEIRASVEKRRLRLREKAIRNGHPNEAPPLSVRSKGGSRDAPPPGRVPLPAMNHLQKEQEYVTVKEVMRMSFISEHLPPSVCLYTVFGAPGGGMPSAAFASDSSLLATGFANGQITVHALDPKRPLLAMKQPQGLLESIDMDAFDAYQQMFDPGTAAGSIDLFGHALGAVTSLDFSSDKRLLLSAGADSTVRLWGLDVRRNLVVHRHTHPVWDTAFCPNGYYFATGGLDSTVQLWATNRTHPLRIMTDSKATIHSVDFHPNSNYIAGGSGDRTVRLWDIATGRCVRTFFGHGSGIRAVKISPDGRHIVSVSADAAVFIWNISENRTIGQHQLSGPVTRVKIEFSRDGGVFAVSLGTPRLYFFSLDTVVERAEKNPSKKSQLVTDFQLFAYATKQTPVSTVHFTHHNVVLCSGALTEG